MHFLLLNRMHTLADYYIFKFISHDSNQISIYLKPLGLFIFLRTEIMFAREKINTSLRDNNFLRLLFV